MADKEKRKPKGGDAMVKGIIKGREGEAGPRVNKLETFTCLSRQRKEQNLRRQEPEI